MPELLSGPPELSTLSEGNEVGFTGKYTESRIREVVLLQNLEKNFTVIVLFLLQFILVWMSSAPTTRLS